MKGSRAQSRGRGDCQSGGVGALPGFSGERPKGTERASKRESTRRDQPVPLRSLNDNRAESAQETRATPGLRCGSIGQPTALSVSAQLICVRAVTERRKSSSATFRRNRAVLRALCLVSRDAHERADGPVATHGTRRDRAIALRSRLCCLAPASRRREVPWSQRVTQPVRRR